MVSIIKFLNSLQHIGNRHTEGLWRIFFMKYLLGQIEVNVRSVELEFLDHAEVWFLHEVTD